MIIEKLVVGQLAANCYIVGSEVGGEGMIIDPGGDASQITSRVRELKLNIKLIVLTHGHSDHAAALKEIKEATGAQVAIHADDTKTLRRRTLNLSLFLGIFYLHPLPSPDRLLKDGDTMDIGSLHFKVLHTPGHSPGSICLLGEGVLFSGDTLFSLSIGRTDLPGGSFDQLMNSIQSQLMALDDKIKVYPGHGPETTIGSERGGNPFLVG